MTTVPRTLLDMSPKLSPLQLARACHEAWLRHDTSQESSEAWIARNPGKHGGKKLLAALGANVDVRGDKVDCHWPESGLTVELLSYRLHASRRRVRERRRSPPALEPRRVHPG